MKIYAIAASIGLIANLGATNVSSIGTNIEIQTLVVPNREISFDRGTYEIVEFEYDKSTILSDKEAIRILRLAGFSGSGLKMAWAIAVRESTLKPFALNTASNCYGLFQINMSGSMGPERRERYGLSSNNDLFNPLINARVAYKMSNGGKSWSAWSTNSQAQKILKDYPLNID